MRLFFNKIFAASLLGIMLFACNRKDSLPSYGNGNAVTLSSTTATLAPTATDSLNNVIGFSWTNPAYATDSANYKFILQIDSAGKNFGSAASKTILGARSTSYIGKEINNILLSKGYAFNVPVSMEVRVISSYANNNERYFSNVLAIRMTPYKIPPVVALPTGFRLWANGGAIIPWSWTGAPPMPASEFARLDETTWAGVFNMNANGEFLVLSQNGGTDPYDRKYAVPNNTVPGIADGGNFRFYPPGTGGDNFKSPSSTGWQVMKMDFQTGKFTTTLFGNALPQDLWALGDGTVGGWNNAPPAAQKFTRLNSCEYTITLALTPGKNLKFVSVSGQWQPQFGKGTADGKLGFNYGGGSDPDVIATPATAGNYKITVNFATLSYKVEPV